MVDPAISKILQAYLECSDDIQTEIEMSVEILTTQRAHSTQDEKDAALDTIQEALFPSDDSDPLMEG